MAGLESGRVGQQNESACDSLSASYGETETVSPRRRVSLYVTVTTCAVPSPAATLQPEMVGPVSAPAPPNLRL